MNALCLRTGSDLFLGRASSSGTRSSSFNVSRKPRSPNAASLRSYVPREGVEIIEEDLVKEFLKERLASGDFISRASDAIWSKGVLSEIVAEEENSFLENFMNFAEDKRNEEDDGFLQLARTREWILGDDTAPLNRRAIEREWKNDSEKRRKLNLLQYEALKKELSLLTIGIGGACGGYCLLTLSPQAAVSYITGVFLSFLYLQLLSSHVDTMSRERVPSIFLQKKSKKIGIRSEDVKNSLERTVKGGGIALASPRLVFPAAIYALWAFSNQYFNDFFDFQLVPGMLGLFAYKAAALVQVYRDNRNLNLELPED